jgi:hypothetical protein
MSRYSAVTCDVCGKRAAELISDWFEIDAGPDGFFAVHQSDRPAGIGRSSRDICGSRCLCVAMERWANGYLRQARDAAAGAEQEPQEWIVPHRVSLKTQKNAPAEESLPDEKVRCRGVFGRGITPGA